METDRTDTWSSKLLWPFAFGVVFLFGVWLRVDGVADRGFEYDEIWTWANYVQMPASFIFTDLALPNNHPLHSLLAKLSTASFGQANISLRLPSLLAGLCVPLLAFLLAWRLLKDKSAALLALAFCSFNGALVHYSQTARGYSMQTFFVLGSAYALFGMTGPRERRFAPFLLLLFGVSAVLTVPSGIVFIAPLCALWLVLDIDWRSSLRTELSKFWPMLLSMAALGFLCLAWYAFNYAKFKAGQSYGESVSTPSALFLFMFSRLWELAGPLWILVFVPLFFKEGRRVGLLCLGLLAVSLLSVLLTKAGPARVYLPLVPFIGLGLAAFVFALGSRFKRAEKPVCCLMALGLAIMALPEKSRWTPIDWSIAAPALMKTLNPGTFLCYPSGECYSVKFNCGPRAIADNAHRIGAFGGHFAQVAMKGKISGLDIQTLSQRDVPVDGRIVPGCFSVGNADVELYALRALNAGDEIAGRTLVAVLGPLPVEEHKKLFYGFFGKGSWLVLNSWFRVEKAFDPEDRLNGDVFINVSCDFPVSGLLELSSLSGGSLRFFTLESPAVGGMEPSK